MQPDRTRAPTIEIIVKPDGQVVVKTEGFTGASCRDASRFIEQALGQRQNEQLTAEFHLTTDQQTEHRLQA